MAEVYTYNATHLTIVRDAEFTQMAEHGSVGGGRVALDDTAGTQAIVGQKNFSHTESACSFPLTFRGFVATRSYGRDAGQERAPHVGAARGIDVTLEDLNATLGFRAIHKADGMTAAAGGKRPAETVAARTAWLLASPFLSGLVADNGRVASVTGKSMDKTDYRQQFPGDVLADMATAAGGFNYHVNDWGAGAELTFRNDNTSTADSSTLRISNVLSDASGVTLHPFTDAVLSRSPDAVKSELGESYARGVEWVERPATATAFNGKRSGTVTNSNIKTAGKAIDDAMDQLHQLSTEEDEITCTLLVTSAQVNLILPGMRIEAKFSHFVTEGYGSAFTWFRILERSVQPVVADGALYELRVRLSPQEAAAAVPGILQSNFDRSGEGGLDLTLPNPVTIGSLLVFVSADRGVNNPASPNYLNADQARFGSTAWTKLPNTTNVNDYGSGVAIWYKTADTAERVGWVPSSTTNMGIYELSGATIAGATTLDETLQANNLTMSLGSLGTAASGKIAIGIILWSDQRLWGAPMPGVTPATGWITDHFDSGFEGGAITENEPFVWIGHATGTGAALTASITRSDAAVLSGIWAGAAILLG